MSGVTRLDRMKRGSGIKVRDDKSSGIEIRISETLVKINPTDPLILTKQAARTSRVYCNWHESCWFGAINVQLSIMANLSPQRIFVRCLL